MHTPLDHEPNSSNKTETYNFLNDKIVIRNAILTSITFFIIYFSFGISHPSELEGNSIFIYIILYFSVILTASWFTVKALDERGDFLKNVLISILSGAVIFYALFAVNLFFFLKNLGAEYNYNRDIMSVISSAMGSSILGVLFGYWMIRYRRKGQN